MATGSRSTGCVLCPPIENGMAQLRILDPDTLEIVVASGRQRLRGQKPDTGAGGLLIRNGRVRITGIMQPHQVISIDSEIAGSVPDAIALLREPRLALLDRHPIELKNPAGQGTVKLTVGLPLERDVRMDDIAIHAQGHLEGVHLGGVAAGRDLDQGVLDLDVNADALRLTGRALLADIPAQIDASMDFRAGPALQVAAERDGVRSAGCETACGGRAGCDPGCHRASAIAGDPERAPQWTGRVGGHRRSRDCGVGRHTA